MSLDLIGHVLMRIFSRVNLMIQILYIQPYTRLTETYRGFQVFPVNRELSLKTKQQGMDHTRFVPEDKMERESQNHSLPHLLNSPSLSPKVKSTRPISLHLSTDTPISLLQHKSPSLTCPKSYSIQTISLDFVAILDQFTLPFTVTSFSPQHSTGKSKDT